MPGFFTRTELQQVKSFTPIVAKCGICRLHLSCNSPKMGYSGNGRKRVLICGEASGFNEDEQGLQFVGKTGQHLEKTLAKIGVDMREDCWIVNSVWCHPKNADGSNRTPKKEIDYCRPNVLRTLRELEPDVVILLGGVPVQSVIGSLWKEKGKESITKWAGWKIPCQKPNTWLVPTFHPSYVTRAESPVLDRMWESHLRAAFELEGKPWDVVPDWKSQVEIILDAEQAATRFRGFIERGKMCAFDYETNSLKPDSDKTNLFCCSISDGRETIAYPWYREAIEATKDFLRSGVPKVASNCFSGDTKFLTREYGNVDFKSVTGETVTVLNHEGRWVRGKVRCYGKQKTIGVTFGRRNYLKTVRCTLNHQWIVLNVPGHDRLPTSELRNPRYGHGRKAGLADQVPYLNAPKCVMNDDEYKAGIRHGMIYGDGSKCKDRIGLFTIRLCGEKAELLPLFGKCSVRYSDYNNGDPQVWLAKQPAELKELPSSKESDSYLIGFVRGLLATDGFVSKEKGQISITGTVPFGEWVVKHAQKIGYNVQKVLSLEKYANRYAGCWKQTREHVTVFFSRQSICPDDLLRSKHKANYQNVELGPFKFTGRDDTEIVEDVYCVEVSEGNSFTLEGGLITGNCKYEHRWSKAKLGITVRNWKWDTMLAAHVLDNRPGITSIKFQAFVRLGMGAYEEEVKPFLKSKEAGSNNVNTIHEADLNKVLRYNALDSLLEYKVARLQMREMKGE